MENECKALPGVAYPGVRDNRSTINTKTGYDLWILCKKMVTHPGMNRAWCRVTTLIEINMLPLFMLTHKGLIERLQVRLPAIPLSCRPSHSGASYSRRCASGTK